MRVYIITDDDGWCYGAFAHKNKAIQYLIKTIRAAHDSYNEIEDNALIDCIEKQGYFLNYNLDKLEVIE